MNEIVEIVLKLLCSGKSMNSCQQFLSSSGYENEVVQILMLAFFPMVFITFLIVIVAKAVVGEEHKKFEVLIAICMIMMIIIQGYWPIVLNISKVWWLALIFLGGLWALTSKMGVGSGGAKASAQYSGSGDNWLKTTLLGRQNTNIPSRLSNQRLASGKIKLIEAQEHELHKQMKGLSDREKESYAAQLAALSLEKKVIEKRRRAGLSPD